MRSAIVPAFICALLTLGACSVTVDDPPRRPDLHEIYHCSTYMYCDGEEYYEDYDICLTPLAAEEEEDDFYFYCDEDGFHNCFHYECSADCFPEGHDC